MKPQELIFKNEKLIERKRKLCVIIRTLTILLGSVVWYMHDTWAFLWSPYVIGQTIIFLPCYFYLPSSFFPHLISAAAGWMSTIL